MAPFGLVLASVLLMLLILGSLVFLVRTAVEAEWEGLLQTLAAEEKALRELRDASGGGGWGSDVAVAARHLELLRESPDRVRAEDLIATLRDLDALLEGGALAGASGEAAERLLVLHEGLHRQRRDYNRWTRRYNGMRALAGRRPLPYLPE